MTSAEQALKTAPLFKDLTMEVVKFASKTNRDAMSLKDVHDFLIPILEQKQKDDPETFMSIAALAISALVQQFVKELNKDKG